MPHEVEQREVFRALESLTQTAVAGVLSHPEWLKHHGVRDYSIFAGFYYGLRGACIVS